MPLLSELGKQDTGRKCLVLDLDETLVHSSFKVSRNFLNSLSNFLSAFSLLSSDFLSFLFLLQAIQNADFIVPVEIEGTTHSVFVIKRPGVDEFMRKMGEIYEVVVFTASLSKVSSLATFETSTQKSIRKSPTLTLLPSSPSNSLLSVRRSGIRHSRHSQSSSSQTFP